MSIEKFTISRDDRIYEAWPDLALTEKGKLICIFTQCRHHRDRADSRIVLRESMDRGRSWSEKTFLTSPCSGDDYWNCARITRLKDGSLVIVCDRIQGPERNNQSTLFLWKGDPEGCYWDGPYETPAKGIVPDKLLELLDNRWILSAHIYGPTGKLEQKLYYSDNQGQSWSGPVTVAADPACNLCEASILLTKSGPLVAFLRENSGQGLDCFKAISYGRGETWQGVYRVPLPGCHRPVSGYLKSGRILITYRFMQGGRGWLGNWTQNFFAALMDEDSALAIERSQQAVRILPIDFDRSPVSDLGYSGWVQFDDGEIYIVNYIVDNAPKAQIRGYSLRESDFLLG